jgi:hypothetical protein
VDDRDRLAFYPFVVVRIACRVCTRSGSYRLARLTAKHGPEITLRELTDRFPYGCLWRGGALDERQVGLRRFTYRTLSINDRPTCRRVRAVRLVVRND